MIQEYRKASAEKLGEIIGGIGGERQFVIRGTPGLSIPLEKWKPDLKKNANQREMIEDWLIGQGCETYCEIHRTSLTKTVQYDYRIVNDRLDRRAINISQESKSTAFMKAFMEYINTGDKK